MRASIKFPPLALVSLVVIAMLALLWTPVLPASSIRPEARPEPRLTADVLTEQVQIDLWTWPYSNFVDSVPYGEVVLFRAWDGVHGWELWCTDGTPAGTEIVADIQPGSEDSWPASLDVVGENLFFTADDGTTAGTRRIGGLTVGRILTFRTPGGSILLSASDGSDGYELWSTDGPRTGTRREGDIDPGPGSSSPDGLTPFGKMLVFSATDGTRGWEIWALDGSSADICKPPRPGMERR